MMLAKLAALPRFVKGAFAFSVAPFMLLTLLLTAPLLHAAPTVTIDHNDKDSSTPAFRFERVPPPSANDAATHALFTIVDGKRSPAGGDLDVLHDNKLPNYEDEPSENFFFAGGTKRARLLVDLREPIDIKQVNTYSWHRAVRAPQAYTLYASDGTAEDFDAQPKNGKNPELCGWKHIAQADTRPITGDGDAGQYGVSISDSEPAATLGRYRYLLFEIFPSLKTGSDAQTFYSEIDVIDAHVPVKFVEYTPPVGFREIFKTDDSVYQFTIDTTQAPEIANWARVKMVPIVKEWYPKIVRLLSAGEGDNEAPKSIAILCKKLKENASTVVDREITLGANWIRKNLKGEAGGVVVYEMALLVQHCAQAAKTNPNATRPPGWLQTGIADYIRWYLYEPQARGADIGPKRAPNVTYDHGYRDTANFLNWVSLKYDSALVFKLNAACRQGLYTAGLWKQHTGRTLQELNEEWKTDLRKQPPK